MERPPPGQPMGLLGIPPAAPLGEEPGGPAPSPWQRTVAVPLPLLLAIAVASGFAGGFALHAALFPGDLPAGFISTSQVEQFAQLGERVSAAAALLSDSTTPDLSKVQEAGRQLREAGAQVKALAGSLKGAAATPAPSAAPGRIHVSEDDDPAVGSKDAKVVMIEFSDFQCPFCRSWYSRTLPELERDYIATGKVRLVYRDFPLYDPPRGLTLHPGARPWAMAAECARDQGRWREMHNKIFDEQNKQGLGTVTYDDYAAVAKQWAREVGLDAAKFDACLDSQKYAAEVEKDYQDGLSAGVSGTPTFFIGSPQRGYISLVGAQPAAAFRQAFDSELAAP